MYLLLYPKNRSWAIRRSGFNQMVQEFLRGNPTCQAKARRTRGTQLVCMKTVYISFAFMLIRLQRSGQLRILELFITLKSVTGSYPGF